MASSDNRQLLLFSDCGQLSQAIPQVDMERILHQWTPIVRSELQRNERRVYEDPILCFEGETYDRERTLVIRIAAIILAGDSAKTRARFRPSKLYVLFPGVALLCDFLNCALLSCQDNSIKLQAFPP